MFNLSRIPLLLAFAASAFIPLATINAHAQKPVLIKDADAPGRSPYQQTVFFNQTSSNCFNNLICIVSFNPVPAGHRLVITHVSAHFKLTSGGTVPDVSVGTPDILGNQLELPAPVFVGIDSYTASSPVTFYVEPGDTPAVIIAGEFIDTNPNTSITASASVVGYLISLP